MLVTLLGACLSSNSTWDDFGPVRGAVRDQLLGERHRRLPGTLVISAPAAGGTVLTSVPGFGRLEQARFRHRPAPTLVSIRRLHIDFSRPRLPLPGHHRHATMLLRHALLLGAR